MGTTLLSFDKVWDEVMSLIDGMRIVEASVK